MVLPTEVLVLPCGLTDLARRGCGDVGIWGCRDAAMWVIVNKKSRCLAEFLLSLQA